MFKLCSALVLTGAVVVAASGNSVTLEQVPYERPLQDLAYDIDAFEAEGWVTYDLVVHVDAGDRWISCGSIMCVCDGGNGFWEHPQGDLDQPTAAMLDYFGLLAYDSFWTSSEEFPNPDLDPSANATTFCPGSPLTLSPAQREAEWYADPVPPNPEGGRYTIARVTAHESTPFNITGSVFYRSTFGQPHPFSILGSPCECGEECVGDLTFDNRVDLDDLGVLLGHYGMTGAPWHYGDLDFDGDVDLADLAELLSRYGAEC